MKRWVWLLLVSVCAALAQVQPVEPLQKQPADCCAGCDGACHMPKCVAPAVPAPIVVEPAAGEVRQVVQVFADEESVPAPAFRRFHTRTLVGAIRPVEPDHRVHAALAPPSEAHCSWLI